jgi:hypothetical protein
MMEGQLGAKVLPPRDVCTREIDAEKHERVARAVGVACKSPLAQVRTLCGRRRERKIL